ncbi:MAG: hypothetical protein A2Y38_03220 [Spirochaetes bacterium GWB1_59_5]|nr:MAG: hypothetical protein A2Y38_03220 [Spirochaetes bacterium GWB1_59_5]
MKIVKVLTVLSLMTISFCAGQISERLMVLRIIERQMGEVVNRIPGYGQAGAKVLILADLTEVHSKVQKGEVMP